MLQYNHWTEIDTSFDIYLIFELVQFLGKYNIAIIVNFKLLGTVFLLQLFSFFLKLSSDWDWDLGLGTWDLGPGTWDLGPGNRIEN